MMAKKFLIAGLVAGLVVAQGPAAFAAGSGSGSGSAPKVTTATIITPEGARVAQLAPEARAALGKELLAGKQEINKYNLGICHDAVCFTLFLLGSKITPNELIDLRGQAWLPKLDYEKGTLWDGKSDIPAGKAIGFYRLKAIIEGMNIFHSAISTGGTKIRGVNAHGLTPGWSVEGDLKKALGAPDKDGCFMYDGAKIKVYISNL